MIKLDNFHTLRTFQPWVLMIVKSGPENYFIVIVCAFDVVVAAALVLGTFQP